MGVGHFCVWCKALIEVFLVRHRVRCSLSKQFACFISPLAVLHDRTTAVPASSSSRVRAVATLTAQGLTKNPNLSQI
jgi:hypothetical protein